MLSRAAGRRVWLILTSLIVVNFQSCPYPFGIHIGGWHRSALAGHHLDASTTQTTLSWAGADRAIMCIASPPA